MDDKTFREKTLNHFVKQKELKDIKLDPLSEEAIKVAKIYIKSSTPLYHEPIENILPKLCCCMKYKRDSSNSNYYPISTNIKQDRKMSVLFKEDQSET